MKSIINSENGVNNDIKYKIKNSGIGATQDKTKATYNNSEIGEKLI